PEYEKFIGKHFPIEQFKNEKGENFDVNLLKGKATFINFWSTTCEPCIEEMPELNRLEENLRNQVNFLGITFSTKENVAKFLTKHQFSFSLITDVNYKTLETNRITRFPTSLVLDKNGDIKRVIGNVHAEDLDIIKKNLTE
ncbi:MAG: TlpA disulfide reductase family protein, partial [Flavobacterium sp.]